MSKLTAAEIVLQLTHHAKHSDNLSEFIEYLDEVWEEVGLGPLPKDEFGFIDLPDPLSEEDLKTELERLRKNAFKRAWEKGGKEDINEFRKCLQEIPQEVLKVGMEELRPQREERLSILERATKSNFGRDPYQITPDILGHRTRMSDSSLYDEVCVTCGATDNRWCGKLRERCSSPLPMRDKGVGK